MRQAPRTRSLLRLTVPAILLAAACGSGGSSSTTGGSGGSSPSSTATSGDATSTGSAMSKTPAQHRPVSSPCTAMRTAVNAGNAQGTCQKDTDCTTGMNGRCVAFLGQASHCSYDDCAADKDCGTAGICDCRNLANFDANTCFHGDCVVDADCGAGGYCSPSAVNLGPDCSTGISPGSFGFFCHTPGDECVDDAECGLQGENACLFSIDKMHWACKQLQCTG